MSFHRHIFFEANYRFYEVRSFFGTRHASGVKQGIPDIFQAFPLCLAKWTNRPVIWQILDNLVKLHIPGNDCRQILR
jgi:hypothetical protein